MSTATAQPASLMTKLNADWARASHRTHDFGSLGVTTGGELLAGIRTSSGAAQDSLLHALVEAAHGGDRNAERVVLQALIPAAQRMAHRVRTLDDFDRGDRVGFAIGAAWESIRSYKLHLTRRVMANLTMNMLGLLTPDKTANDRHIADQTIPVSDDVLEVQAGAWQEPEEPAEVQLARLFTWAVDTGVLTRSEVALLSRAALGDEKHQEIADELGITVVAFRHRVDRIRGRLSQAAREQL